MNPVHCSINRIKKRKRRIRETKVRLKNSLRRSMKIRRSMILSLRKKLWRRKKNGKSRMNESEED
jgi:hypothetical protein